MLYLCKCFSNLVPQACLNLGLFIHSEYLVQAHSLSSAFSLSQMKSFPWFLVSWFPAAWVSHQGETPTSEVPLVAGADEAPGGEGYRIRALRTSGSQGSRWWASVGPRPGHVALQCRSAPGTHGLRSSTRRRGPGGCCVPHAPTPGWRGSAVRRWASSGTRVALEGGEGWSGAGGGSDPSPVQGPGALGAGCANRGRQRHVGLLLRGRGPPTDGSEVVGCHLCVVSRAAAGGTGPLASKYHPNWSFGSSLCLHPCPVSSQRLP